MTFGGSACRSQAAIGGCQWSASEEEVEGRRQTRQARCMSTCGMVLHDVRFVRRLNDPSQQARVLCAGDADAVSAATLEQQILEEDYNKMMQAKEAGKCMEIVVNHFHRTLEPKTVELPDSATVRDLKRHLARIDFNGKAVRTCPLCIPLHVVRVIGAVLGCHSCPCSE